MKTLKNTFIAIFSATVFFGCINSATAQENDVIKSEQSHIYDIVEQMPTFPGGEDSLVTFLYRNVKYPQFDHGCVEGRVIVRFVVDENGDIKDTEILRKLDPAFDREALRVISLMPKWTPGKQDGKNVAVWFTLPITFRITTQRDIPIENPDTMPTFPGGEDGLLAFLSKNVKYPIYALENGIQGVVKVRFVVEKDGSIRRAKILQSISPELDDEAFRIISLMPNWIPGKQNGENVAVLFTLPVTFRIAGQESIPLKKAKVMPAFPGGNDEFMVFLNKNINYPSSAVQNKTQGRVIVRFVVDENGNIKNPEIKRSLSPDCDREALRAISLMPKWIPGKQNGKNVAVWFTLPITFRITN